MGTNAQVGEFRSGSLAPCFATPTPYASNEAVTYLVLPAVTIPREHVLLVDAARIPEIVGPMWVAIGKGIQYYLPVGFPEDAIVVPGAPGAHWEVEVS